MKNEFALAFNEVIEEKQLPKEVILKAIESAMVSAYRKAKNASQAQQIDAKIDPESGKVVILAEKEVVDSVEDERTEVSLEAAKRINPASEIGMMIMVESTPDDFGRVAAQTARQVIQQRIRDAERQLQLDHYQSQVGEIISGNVQAVNSQGATVGLEMRAEGNLQKKDMIPGERFFLHNRVRALIAEVKDNPKGPLIVLSRTHRDFLRRLLENEVPEIYHGIVEIRSITREPGERAKIAVSATQAGIDPVGACVGMRGVRIQAIVRELHNEKIDVIEWSDDPTKFIEKALSPARVIGVYLNDTSSNNKTATVVVSEDQLSLAIGRDGQNARLAARLTNWRIDIKSLTEAVNDCLNKLRKDPDSAALFEAEKNRIPEVEAIILKKFEGRTITPEEYNILSKFVDRVERQTTAEPVLVETSLEEPLKVKIRSEIPDLYFQQNILDSGLPEHVNVILQGAGYLSVGDLVSQMKYRTDDVLRLQGIGPRAMTEITKLMQKLAIEISGLVVSEIPEDIATQTNIETPEHQTPAENMITQVTTEGTPGPAPDAISAETSPVASDTTEPSLIVEKEVPVEELVEQKGISEVEIDPEKREPTFEELMALQRDGITPVLSVGEEEDDELSKDKGKKGKKKKKNVEIEYDPERDLTIVHKKHKRSETDWDWDG